MSELMGPVTVKLNNLSVMELNTIRPFFQIALQRFHEFAQVCVETVLWNTVLCWNTLCMLADSPLHAPPLNSLRHRCNLLRVRMAAAQHPRLPQQKPQHDGCVDEYAIFFVCCSTTFLCTL